MSLLSFDHQFVKYGEFHANKINQGIHMIFVPTILWTAQVWLTATPVLYKNWAYGHILPINVAFIGTTAYAGYYLALHKTIGIMATPLLFGMLYTANEFAKFPSSQLGSYSPMSVAAGIHVLSWIFQILGHQVFEGRAPAFTKEPIQALVLAPLFVFCEFLFALGLFPKTAARLNKKIQEKVKIFRTSKAKKSS